MQNSINFGLKILKETDISIKIGKYGQNHPLQKIMLAVSYELFLIKTYSPFG